MFFLFVDAGIKVCNGEIDDTYSPPDLGLMTRDLLYTRNDMALCRFSISPLGDFRVDFMNAFCAPRGL